jgi:hypothetical protein
MNLGYPLLDLENLQPRSLFRLLYARNAENLKGLLQISKGDLIMSFYIIEAYDCRCSLKTFKINGIDADYDEFGDKEDIDRENAADYCCGNMTFTPRNAKQEVLDKYKISQEQYDEVCDKLVDALSFGSCGWCC